MPSAKEKRRDRRRVRLRKDDDDARHPECSSFQWECRKGEILYCGEDVLKMSNAKLQEYRQKGAGMIFQDPSSALNPVISIKNQFLEALKYAHKDKKLTKAQLLEKAGKSLEAVSLADPERILNSYPFQLSGGMRQRVCIAMTLAAERQLLLADEPGTALDVTIQDQILRLIKQLVDSGELSVIMVTHSLGSYARLRRKSILCMQARW